MCVVGLHISILYYANHTSLNLSHIRALVKVFCVLSLLHVLRTQAKRNNNGLLRSVIVLYPPAFLRAQRYLFDFIYVCANKHVSEGVAKGGYVFQTFYCPFSLKKWQHCTSYFSGLHGLVIAQCIFRYTEAALCRKVTRVHFKEVFLFL